MKGETTDERTPASGSDGSATSSTTAVTTLHDPTTGEHRRLRVTRRREDGPAQKFGTFLGVYTPSVLTILGLIMYLRFGWVVGNVGLGSTLLIVLLASSITCITALSASAVATNMRVGVGGEYYMVSHSLGLELGGAIGIPLFLCRTLSLTFYSFGFAESLIALWSAARGEPHPRAVQLIAAVTVILITAIAGKSAAVALKLQIPIMVAVSVSLVALAAGVFSGPLQTPAWTGDYPSAPGFWYVFAVFFPAVTGFTAGIGMSGDLADPRRSIPRGTLAAVGTGTAVYLAVPLLLAATGRLDPEQLASPGIGVWTLVAFGGVTLIYPGVWGAILSSAFGSALGGPRVLQALATDGLAPRAFARLSRTGQPTVATWVSGAIALAAVALGGLDAVAQFVTVLFLTLYVTINLSAALEKLVGDPSYRPTLNVPWWLALLGSAGAVAVMFLINPLACTAAIVLEMVLLLVLRRLALAKRWGDVRAGMWVALARLALLRLRRHENDPRNWRPYILAFVGDPEKRIDLVRLATWFNQSRGVVTACNLVIGNLQHEAVAVEEIRGEMQRALDDEGLLAFCEVDVVSDFERGMVAVAQANGIAGLQSNTVLFGWSDKPERLVSRLRIMRALSRAGKSAVIARLTGPLPLPRPPGASKPRIDLWWGGLENNGDLMLLLAYLLSLNPEWRGARIVVRSIVGGEDERAMMAESLARLIPETRIHAETEILIRPPGKDLAELLHEKSGDAEVVFLGLKDPEPGTEADYAARLIELSEGLRATIFVRNSGEFAGSLV